MLTNYRDDRLNYSRTGAKQWRRLRSKSGIELVIKFSLLSRLLCAGSQLQHSTRCSKCQSSLSCLSVCSNCAAMANFDEKRTNKLANAMTIELCSSAGWHQNEWKNQFHHFPIFRKVSTLAPRKTLFNLFSWCVSMSRSCHLKNVIKSRSTHLSFSPSTVPRIPVITTFQQSQMFFRYREISSVSFPNPTTVKHSSSDQFVIEEKSF